MARTAAQELAAFVAGTGFADLPTPVTDAAKVYLLDNFAAGFAGAGQPWTLMAGEMAREQGNDGPCSVFGASWRSSPSYAALVNGIAVGGFECDHAHVPGLGASGGSGLSLQSSPSAERLGLDGASFAAAMALGYEVLCRVGLAATRAVEEGKRVPRAGDERRVRRRRRSGKGARPGRRSFDARPGHRRFPRRRTARVRP